MANSSKGLLCPALCQVHVNIPTQPLFLAQSNDLLVTTISIVAVGAQHREKHMTSVQQSFNS